MGSGNTEWPPEVFEARRKPGDHAGATAAGKIPLRVHQTCCEGVLERGGR